MAFLVLFFPVGFMLALTALLLAAHRLTFSDAACQALGGTALLFLFSALGQPLLLDVPINSMTVAYAAGFGPAGAAMMAAVRLLLL